MTRPDRQRGTMDEVPGEAVPADRQWGWCRRITPELRTLLARKGYAVASADHVVVLKLDAANVMLVFWLGERALYYQNGVASVGRDIARLGAPESV